MGRYWCKKNISSITSRLYLYCVSTCVSTELCISQSAHVCPPWFLSTFLFAGACSITPAISHTSVPHPQTLLTNTFQIMLSSAVATEFSEELHLATCTPRKRLYELERSGLSTSKSIFDNGGNYRHLNAVEIKLGFSCYSIQHNIQ